MTTRTRNAKRWDKVTGLLLVMLLFRAYVPAGFMPAGGTPFLLELCPEASFMAVSMVAAVAGHQHHHGSQTHAHFEHCPFGSVPASGPISHCVAFDPPGQTATSPIPPLAQVRLTANRLRTHQPRGPPIAA